MTLQKSTALRDAQNDAIETILGASPKLEIRTGPPPANSAAADTGTKLADMTLPADPMAASAAGVKSKSGTWQDPSADATGKPGHFRLKTSGGTTVMQGICAGPWLPATAYVVGDTVLNDGGKVYRCDTAGTSAGAGGPTGTTQDIVDNTARWDYIQAAAEMPFDASIINALQQVNINQFDITASGA